MTLPNDVWCAMAATRTCFWAQVHEWGGVSVDIVTYSHFRRFRPGLRLAINPHGGHYWSTQGQLPRPTDIMSLRIDAAERATMELADLVLSPTRYIMSWLRQRGWKLPDKRCAPLFLGNSETCPLHRNTCRRPQRRAGPCSKGPSTRLHRAAWVMHR